MSENIQVRKALPEDAKTLQNFIEELAIYEKKPLEVKVTPDVLRTQLASDKPPFEALIAEDGDTPLGMALFFPSYSTWEGQAGLYLEDLYVSQDHRGSGIGTKLFQALAKIALARGYPRIDWQVLDWNEPSIKYYQSIGGDIRKDWYPCRLEGDALTDMASGTKKDTKT